MFPLFFNKYLDCLDWVFVPLDRHRGTADRGENELAGATVARQLEAPGARFRLDPVEDVSAPVGRLKTPQPKGEAF